MTDLVLVSVASFFAGLMDAIVGGGGLILVPALFSVFPGALPATLLGVNKGAATWGTALAAAQYAMRVKLRWRSLVPAAVTASIGSILGAWVVTEVPPLALRKLTPILLCVILAYTVLNKNLGKQQANRFSDSTEAYVTSILGFLIGLYDGFFGPGAGSFFVFMFVRAVGYDFLLASASAKVVNTATNLAALILFAIKGHIWWSYVAAMAAANIVGSLIGARLALRHGPEFVRTIFILVVAALVLRTGYDAFSAAR